jgi:DNA-binding response OmpR family regulator
MFANDNGPSGAMTVGREANSRPVHILYVGRMDANHENLWQQLQREGLAVAFSRTQRAGLQMAKELQPQVVVVNTSNGHFSGDRLCRTLGRSVPAAQRLLIAERGSGANVPCEQRLVRPFTGRKLRESLLKLMEAAAPHVVRAGTVELDTVARVVTGPQGRHHLTPKQCDLLAAFIQHPNQVLSRKDLMEKIWDTAYLGDTRTLDVHVRWLREKIELNPERPLLLQTRRGIGYLLAIPDREPASADPTDEPLDLD